MNHYFRILVCFLCATTLYAQTSQTTPGENMVVEGVPPIPSDLVRACFINTSAG
jgi:hypothetical protein